MNRHPSNMDFQVSKPNDIQVSKDFISRIMYEENRQQSGTVDGSQTVVGRQPGPPPGHPTPVPNTCHAGHVNKCLQCPTAATMLETFLQMHTAASHAEHHHPPPPQSCEVREKSTKSKKKKSRSSSKSNIVSTNNGLYCKQCMVAASSLNALILHMVDHTPNKEPNMCGNCDYQTKNRGNFKRHVMTHVNIRPFKCHLCPFTASQKTHLVKHMKYHGHVGCFMCEQCSYGCSDKANFNRHKNLHVSHPASASVVVSAPMDKNKVGQFSANSLLASAVPLLNYQQQGGQNLNSMVHNT